MMMQQAQQRQAQGPQGGEQAQSPVEAIDQMLGMMTQALSQNPQREILAKRMQKLREEYRSIITEAAKGAGEQQGQNQAIPTIPRAQPMADNSRGMPASPAGAY